MTDKTNQSSVRLLLIFYSPTFTAHEYRFLVAPSLSRSPRKPRLQRFKLKRRILSRLTRMQVRLVLKRLGPSPRRPLALLPRLEGPLVRLQAGRNRPPPSAYLLRLPPPPPLEWEPRLLQPLLNAQLSSPLAPAATPPLMTNIIWEVGPVFRRSVLRKLLAWRYRQRQLTSLQRRNKLAEWKRGLSRFFHLRLLSERATVKKSVALKVNQPLWHIMCLTDQSALLFASNAERDHARSQINAFKNKAPVVRKTKDTTPRPSSLKTFKVTQLREMLGLADDDSKPEWNHIRVSVIPFCLLFSS